MPHYASLGDCIRSGDHLRTCDKDGYCDFCGQQENPPHIIVHSKDEEDAFRWMSDGWYQIHQHGDPEAEALMKKARKCIEAGADVLDTIKRLGEAGFLVTREWMPPSLD